MAHVRGSSSIGSSAANYLSIHIIYYYYCYYRIRPTGTGYKYVLDTFTDGVSCITESCRARVCSLIYVNCINSLLHTRLPGCNVHNLLWIALLAHILIASIFHAFLLGFTGWDLYNLREL